MSRLRRRGGTSVPRPKLDRITFVIDEDTGISAAQGIRDAGGHAVLLNDYVPKGAKDVEWLPMVKNWGHALVTRDVAMRTDHREAFLACGVHVFEVRAAGLGFDALRELLKTHHAAMCRLVRKHGLPFVARVRRSEVDVKFTAGRPGAIQRC